MADLTPSDGSETEREPPTDENSPHDAILPVVPATNFLRNSDITEEKSSSQFTHDQICNRCSKAYPYNYITNKL